MPTPTSNVSPATVQAAVAAAQAADIDWSDMALLLKQAITQAILSATGEVELPWSSTGADGVQMTRISLEDATKMYAKFNSLSSGGLVPQLVEFSNPATTGLLL